MAAMRPQASGRVERSPENQDRSGQRGQHQGRPSFRAPCCSIRRREIVAWIARPEAGCSGETGAANREVLAVSVGSGQLAWEQSSSSDGGHGKGEYERPTRAAKDKRGSDISILAHDSISIDGPARAFASVSKRP